MPPGSTSSRSAASNETATRFRLGWAPDEWRGLRDHLANRGFGERDAVAAGVLVEPESGGAPYDRFRGRVIIPILDERGRVVALGGRGLHGEMPKYLNSPQTEVFDKSRTLYGLHLAADEIPEAGDCRRSRRLYGCHRPAPGRVHERRRHDGHLAHGAACGTTEAIRAARCSRHGPRCRGNGRRRTCRFAPAGHRHAGYGGRIRPERPGHHGRPRARIACRPAPRREGPG